MQALLVPLHGDWYAIELTRVREVVPAPVVTPLPGAPPALTGVFNLRGDVVPLFDTAALLGLAPGDSADQIVVADTAGGAVGLLAHGRPEGGDLDDARAPTLIDVDELLDQVVA
jgi:purine-binding chemotaxis protein CheW